MRPRPGAPRGRDLQWGGGVVIISHHAEFVGSLCTERWALGGGACAVSGAEWWAGFEKARKKEAERAAKSGAKGGGGGAKAKEGGGKEGGGKEGSRAAISKLELKKVKKRVAELRKQGAEVTTDEELRKAGYVVDVE